ncbi:MAG: TonB-dependent receptor [Saprospiraceae bacterium]
MQKIIFLVFLFMASKIGSQSFTGNVLDRQNKAFYGAVIYWLGSTAGTTSNENGYFKINRTPENKKLVLSYVGFKADTVEIPESLDFDIFYLDEGITLNTIDVDGIRNSNTFSRLNPLNIETLERKEFKKAACCSLSESFQTSNAVDLSYSNAATGSKEIQFLGLRGLYTQFLIENRPAFAGILSNTGYDLIPGTWLDQVNIQKGASTTIYGAQSMAGAINVQLKKPDQDAPVFVNVFRDLHGRTEANLHLNKIWNEKRSSGLYLNSTYHDANRDHNGDSFQDDSKINRLNGMFRNTFYSHTFEGQINAQALVEKRKAGQIKTDNPYLIDQEISHINLFGNLGYVNFKKELQNMGSIYDFSYSKINSSFGNTIFQADEKRASAQLFYIHPFQDGIHVINTGPSFHYNQAEEIRNQDTIQYKESVVGVFLDYSFRNTLHLDNSFSFTISQRFDLINGKEALYLPRANLRYLFAEDWTIRASIGRGYRFPRIFSDQSGLFASSKSMIIEDIVKLEKSWNTGMNITGKPYLNGKELTINFDLYYTWFQNQLLIDLDENDAQVHFYALEGKSNALQLITTLSYPILDVLNFKIGAKYTHSYSDYKKGNLQNLQIPKYRGLVSLDFSSPNKKWLLNLTSIYVGKMRLSAKENIPHEISHNHLGNSNDYVMLQSQLNFTHKKWEFYTGLENILNYTQHDAIIDSKNPFGPYFNATEVYAPVAGIKPYVGIKWSL